jgi:hypothetical protein
MSRGAISLALFCTFVCFVWNSLFLVHACISITWELDQREEVGHRILLCPPSLALGYHCSLSLPLCPSLYSPWDHEKNVSRPRAARISLHLHRMRAGKRSEQGQSGMRGRTGDVYKHGGNDYGQDSAGAERLSITQPRNKTRQ